jgi:DNA-directed RNA polymerase subunit omega
MNTELVKQALEKIRNPNILVNVISRRVRQLNSGGGGFSRPLVDAPVDYGWADVALLEVIEDKISYDLLSPGALADQEPVVKPRRKRRSSAAVQAAAAAAAAPVAVAAPVIPVAPVVLEVPSVSTPIILLEPASPITEMTAPATEEASVVVNLDLPNEPVAALHVVEAEIPAVAV